MSRVNFTFVSNSRCIAPNGWMVIAWKEYELKGTVPNVTYYLGSCPRD